jgi:RNA polymerase sigma-70 factor (ECF subfamily)
MINKMINIKDHDLIRSVADGDDYAFKVLVYRYQQQVLNLIFRYLGDRSEAEDLTQEVFLRVWKSARTFKPKAKFTTWLYRIAINLCINRQRSQRIRKLFTVSESDPQAQEPDEMLPSNWGGYACDTGKEPNSI